MYFFFDAILFIFQYNEVKYPSFEARKSKGYFACGADPAPKTSTRGLEVNQETSSTEPPAENRRKAKLNSAEPEKVASSSRTLHQESLFGISFVVLLFQQV